MDKRSAISLIQDTLENPFDKRKFAYLVSNMLDHIEAAPFIYRGNFIPDAYKPYISTLERIGKYKDREGNKIDLLIVRLKKETSLERARTMQRNFIAWYLNGSRGDVLKDAALAAFVSPDIEDWRFSLVKMDYRLDTSGEKVKVKKELTPARRWSFLVGTNEKSHTAQSQLVSILANDKHDPTLKEIEQAFDIETVTKEFFLKYRELFLHTKEELDKIVTQASSLRNEFEAKGVDTVNFAKKLLGQIIFLYFLQKKGWFGVGRDNNWGTGSKHFLRELFNKKHGDYNNFFNDILEPLFYDALRNDRSHDDGYYSRFNCKIPFLNGGLFDPIGNYDWVHIDILLPNKLFSNQTKTKEGDKGTGILDVFDRYNFTVKEDEPLEKEVAIDPELLGKSYEKFNAIRPDNYAEFKKALKSGKKGEENKFNKKFGVYYTPREIVHYMCQQSLINYLDTAVNTHKEPIITQPAVQKKIFGPQSHVQQTLISDSYKPIIPKKEIENLIHTGEQFSENEARVLSKGRETKTYSHQLPESIRKNAKQIDDKLAEITVCDPAVGSGAFPVGMMSEIVKTRNVLSVFIDDKNRKTYNFKRRCIEHSLYGVDIDPGAVEIAKLRLWLSLVVDEDDIKNIKPLPNLDYKVVCGNSLLGVEKNLFNYKLFNELEKLKPLFFNETNPTKKQKYKKQIDKLISEITSGHTEFDFEVYFSEVFHEKGGFDIVIANPPYVGEKGNKEIFQEAKKGLLSKFYQRKMDVFYFFFHLALNLGKQNSAIAFITTNYYPTATAATKLRQDFKKRAIIKNLINFNELKIFESALGQHNMITVLEKWQDEKIVSQTCITRRQGAVTPEILQKILNGNDEKTNYYKVVHKILYDGNECYIRLIGNSKNSKNHIQSILEKIKTQGTILSEIAYVNQGLRTGADKVTNKHINSYNLKNVEKGEGIYIISKKEFKNFKLNDSEKNKIKPLYKNSDILKYYCKHRSDFFLIDLFWPNDRNINIENIPNIITHLKKFRTILENRKENANGIDKAIAKGIWWPASVRRRLNFEVEKIVSPQRSRSNVFAYNDIPWYTSADVYFITKKKPFISLKYILALLNSKLYFTWLYYRGKRKGEMLELYGKPLSEIPIKKTSENEQKLFIEIVDKILLITQSNDYPQNSQKQAKVKALEEEIDKLVYKLYGLTPEEIKIVEGGLIDNS